MYLTPRELQKQAIAGFLLPGLIFLIWYTTLLINMNTQEPQKLEDIKPGYYLLKTNDLPPVACEVFDNDGDMTVCGTRVCVNSLLKSYDLTKVTFVRLVPEPEKAAAFVQGWRVGSSDTPRTDAAVASGGNQLLNIANCSRSLERELAIANATIAKLREEVEKAYIEGCNDKFYEMTSSLKSLWNNSRAKRVMEGLE